MPGACASGLSEDVLPLLGAVSEVGDGMDALVPSLDQGARHLDKNRELRRPMALGNQAGFSTRECTVKLEDKTNLLGQDLEILWNIRVIVVRL